MNAKCQKSSRNSNGAGIRVVSIGPYVLGVVSAETKPFNSA